MESTNGRDQRDHTDESVERTTEEGDVVKTAGRLKRRCVNDAKGK